MARTYPAKRAYIAKGFGIPPCTNPPGPFALCSCEKWAPVWCPVCDEDIEDGQRIVEREHEGLVGPMHARCADAGEALP